MLVAYGTQVPDGVSQIEEEEGGHQGTPVWGEVTGEDKELAHKGISTHT